MQCNELPSQRSCAGGIASFLLCLLVFAIPLEHIYNKFFRFYSLTLIPEGLSIPEHFYKKIYFYPSDWIVLTLIALALFCFRIPWRSLFFYNGAFYLWVILFLSFLSLAVSPFAHYPVPYTHLWHFATPFFLFSFMANALASEDRRKIIVLVLGCFICTALIQSAFAIAQYMIQGPLGLRRLFGEPSVFALIPIPGGRRWIFDTVVSGVELKSIIRPSGTMGHANVLGRFLGAALIACYPFFENPKLKKPLSLCFPFLFFAMTLTFSRSALFGWLFGTLFFFSTAVWRNGWRATLVRPSIKSLGLLIAASITFSFAILHEQIFLRGGIVNYNGVSHGADLERLHWQAGALATIQKHPLLGCGFEQIPVPVHNIYLYLAAESGLCSLLAFFLFIGTVLKIALRSPPSPELGALSAMFVASLLIGLCEPSPPFSQESRLLFFLPACLIALQKEPSLVRWQRYGL